MSIMDNVQPAVKKETGKVAAITGIGLILMWIVFGVLHAFMPQKVPFDYTVFLGGAVGGGHSENEDQSKLLPENADPDVVGDLGNRGTLFSFCGRNRSSFISRNRNQNCRNFSY